jgi:hypothetical protein
MQTSRLLRRPLAVAGLVALSFGALSAVVPAVASASTPATNNVIKAAYAKKLGFSKVVVAPKSSSNTGEKHCTNSAESLYESSDGKVGIVSEALICSSPSTAAAALKEARGEATADKTISLPKTLGKTAFATSSQAPQYTVIWQHGSKVGVAAIDTDVPASASESTEAGTFPPITKAQTKLLTALATYQNGLMSK